MSIRTIVSKVLKVAVPAMVAATVAFAAPQTADAQIRVDVGVPAIGVGVYPSAAYIATATPEYYEGRPVYYYGNQWYYRDHGRWSYYRSEPGYLRDRRAHWVAGPGYRGGAVYRGGYRYHYRR
jgi:hypothetical protein